MELKKLSDKVVAELSSFLTKEYTASRFYAYASSCFNEKGYKIASAYCFKESNEELEHAKKLQNYANDWNCELRMEQLGEPQETDGIVDFLQKAYELEYNLLGDYEQSCANSLDRGDIKLFSFYQKYVKIQEKSVAEYADKLNMVKLFNEKDMSMIFLFEEKIFGN